MKTKIKNKKLSSIKITIESHFELRALVILVKFAEHPAFHDIAVLVEKFDDIPVLGNYCKEYILKTPIALLFNMLTNRKSHKLSNQEKQLLLIAAKKAICEYNDGLQRFYQSEFFNDPELMRYVFKLFYQTYQNDKNPISVTAFNNSEYIKNRRAPLFERDDIRNYLYSLYVDFNLQIRGMFPPNVHYKPDIPQLNSRFRALSNRIVNDESLHPPSQIPIRASLIPYPHLFSNHQSVQSIKGVDIHSWQFRVTPTFAATSVIIFVAAMLTTCKSIYDNFVRLNLEGDSYRTHLIVDNCYYQSVNLLLFYLNYLLFTFKRDYDDSVIKKCIDQLANDIPYFGIIKSESSAHSIESVLTNVITSEEEMRSLIPLVDEEDPEHGVRRYGAFSP